MILEGNFIEAAAVSQAGSLSYDLSTSIEPLSRLAEFDLPFDVVKAVADKFAAPCKMIVVVTLSRAMAGGNQRAHQH